MREAEEIKCPKCGYVFEPEDMYYFTTMWAEDGPKESDCPNCETKLVIDETVSRTFDVTLKEADDEMS